jgi:hypothetical protein
VRGVEAGRSMSELISSRRAVEAREGGGGGSWELGAGWCICGRCLVEVLGRMGSKG